jgi:putative hemolysin
MEMIIVFLLIVINGIFAMAEIAIVSSRKSKLKQLADQGNLRAQKTLDLANSPNHFLATVQIGITFIGIFAGAFGGDRIAESLAIHISSVPFIGQYSETVSLFVVVSIITYLSLVIGELVPKRLGLSNPENIAMTMYRPMHALSVATAPLVRLLSISTEWILSIFQLKAGTEASITEDEVRMLIKEGARTGVFNLTERDIVERAFRLSDKKVVSLMTPRKEIKWLDVAATKASIRKTITNNPYSYFPVCRGTLDQVIGVIRTKEALTKILSDKEPDLREYMRKSIFVPENMHSWKMLEIFKKSGIHVALIVDEYGAVTGLLSLTDILEEIVGDIPTIDEQENDAIIKRNDESWLVDGLTTMEEFVEVFGLQKQSSLRNEHYHTIGGLVMHMLDSVPKTGDSFAIGEFHFEVIDMDENRVDKVLVKRITKPA